LIATIKKSAANFGGSLNAFTCYLVERSLKTLAIRVAKQNVNALTIARHLETNLNIERVYYPGLKTHADYEVAAKQMKGFGGMLSFELKGQRVDSPRFLSKLELIKPALSLGGVETIICSPAQTSHLKMSDEDRAELGITEHLLRLSVGIEDPDDLIADIENALE
jgi:cystathionine beta-lyase